ncbi:MAG: TolC family protein, partial [Acidithiobacillus ferrivorans]
MYANIPGRFNQPPWGNIRLSVGVLLLLSATPAGAVSMSLQSAEAIALRQNPGLGALTQKIAELRHKAVAVAQMP